jgi:trigger factor
MQVTETLNEGLKRGYKVFLAASDLDARLTKELEGYKDRVQIKGFRPGKVPLPHLRRLYGRSVMSEVLQNAVNEANGKIVEDNKLKLAMEPKITLPTEQGVMEKVLDAKADLDIAVEMEILPTFKVENHDDIALEREVVDVTDAEVDERVQDLAKNQRDYTEKKGKSVKDDRVTIDFLGTIDGVAFDGGKGEGFPLVLGSGQFIPGFEDQLIGSKAGDSKDVKVTFPADYSVATLAGKDAVFVTTVHKVEAPGEITVDDEFGKKFGFEGLAPLKDRLRETIANRYSNASRRKLKRKLLDELDKKYSFELPPTLVDQEFSGIWTQVEAEMKRENKSFADEDTTEEKARAEYKGIAERRVRLGLVLAAVGEDAKIEITDEEVSRTLIDRARQFPGQERQVIEFYRKNAGAMASLRAPIFEDKVVDFMLTSMKVSEKTVSKEELLKDAEDDEE